MDFNLEKKRYVEQLAFQQKEHQKDKSKKGFLDFEVKELVTAINQLDQFYTTSSCAGRIILFRAVTSKKCDNQWIYVSHKKVQKKQLISLIQSSFDQNENSFVHDENTFAENKGIRVSGKGARDEGADRGVVWLRYEPLILHVCAASVEDAEQFLDLARQVGFKRGGITSAKKRVMMEIAGVDRLDVPLAFDQQLFADEKYLGFLIDEANKKLLCNLERIKKFIGLLKKI